MQDYSPLLGNRIRQVLVEVVRLRAEPKGKSMDSPIMPLLAQILEVQRLFRDKVIEELPLPARKARINNYILECERILFSPRLFREIGVRLAKMSLPLHSSRQGFLFSLNQISLFGNTYLSDR